jgi:hypothetical protein
MIDATASFAQCGTLLKNSDDGQANARSPKRTRNGRTESGFGSDLQKALIINRLRLAR